MTKINHFATGEKLAAPYRRLWTRVRPAGQRRKQQAEDLRDLGKIALVLFVITIGYFQFTPEAPEGRNQIMAMAQK